MSENTTEAPAAPQETAEQPQEGTQEEAPKTFDADYVANLRKEAAKYRTEAKDLRKEVDQIRQSSMSEAEKAVAEAEARGRAAASTEFGKRLARTEFDAIAGRRNPDFDTASALDFIDLGRFVGEDGEPDKEAIKAAVERLVPAAANVPPSFDGGPRTPASPTQDMNTFLRKATGRA